MPLALSKALIAIDFEVMAGFAIRVARGASFSVGLVPECTDALFQRLESCRRGRRLCGRAGGLYQFGGPGVSGGAGVSCHA
jgi:hypothetical protein